SGSTLRRGRISRLRRRASKCGDVGPSIVVSHYGRLVLVRDDRLRYAWHGFEAFSNNERAVGAVPILHGQCDGFLAAKAVEQARTLTEMAAKPSSLLTGMLRS